MKDLWMEALDEVQSEAEEKGIALSDNEAEKLAHTRAMDNYFSMCDAAKDRAKYL
jgi:hypothetical protein